MTAKRLLIVDDNRAFGEFVRKVASSAGYEVEVTVDGRAFKSRYRTFRPTTVIVDLIMPEIDGIELVQWVADQKVLARVIVVTGFLPEYVSLAKLLGEGRGLDPVTTLLKPVRAARLRRVLAEAPPAAADGDKAGRNRGDRAADGTGQGDDLTVKP